MPPPPLHRAVWRGFEPSADPSPPLPRLEAGRVHVWCWEQTAPAGLAEGVLSSAELARAGRFAERRRGLSWAGSRTTLRVLLGRYLDLAPSEVELELGASGKPRLAGHPGSPLFFNLSHSGPVTIFAFSRSDPVGIDVESGLRPRDVVGIAARVFGAAEAARLAALEPPAREDEFLRTWVGHEALLKCHGGGFGGEPEEREEAIGGAPAPPPPWVAGLAAPGAAAAAIAVAREPSGLELFELVGGLSRAPTDTL